jgi:GTP-binding protein HflX
MAPRPRAVLVGVQTQLQFTEHFQASLAELGRLCDTVGFEVVGQVTQRRSGRGSANLLGDGKLAELARWTGGSGLVARGPQKTKKKAHKGDPSVGDPEVEEAADEPAEADDEAEPESTSELDDPLAPDHDPSRQDRRADVVVVDADLSPSQLRNLGSASGVEVLDRTGVILEIFHRNARTREARLQVEIARLAYVAPRLRETGSPSERQAGRGAGESDIELDRRKIRDRIAELKRELADIESERANRRARRASRQVALVGYTNAGKSSLMRALTQSELYVADQLFATLDTTVRRLQPEVTPPILVTDTVGFIRDLPHDLVASFRSTLDAALDASLVLHVVDASDADMERQREVTREVLAQIQADDIPRRLVLNKSDKLSPEALADLQLQYPDAWFTSAKSPDMVADLHRRIVEHFTGEMREVEVFVPWARLAVQATLRAQTQVLSEDFEDDGVRYRILVNRDILTKLRAALV